MPFSVMNSNTLFFVEHFCRIMDFGKGPIATFSMIKRVCFFPCSLKLSIKFYYDVTDE